MNEHYISKRVDVKYPFQIGCLHSEIMFFHPRVVIIDLFRGLYLQNVYWRLKMDVERNGSIRKISSKTYLELEKSHRHTNLNTKAMSIESELETLKHRFQSSNQKQKFSNCRSFSFNWSQSARNNRIKPIIEPDANSSCQVFK